MGDENQGIGALDEVMEPGPCLVEEGGVAHAEGLVDQQDRRGSISVAMAKASLMYIPLE